VMKVSKWMAISSVFAILLVISLYGCYTFISMPLTRSKNNVDLRYAQSAEYSYTAFVEPSLLYDNRTEIGKGEPLYKNLVEQIEIILKYELSQTPTPVEMTGIEVRYEASATLSGGDWMKTYPLNSMRSNSSSFTETYTINIEEIEDIVETIGEETETRVYAYTYEINPRIRLDASAGNEYIEQEFNPTLKIKFEGGKIEFEGLSSTKTGSVTHHETEKATYKFLGSFEEINYMRGITVMGIIAFSTMLFYSGRNALRERESRTFMERLSGDIRDRIVEAFEPPERIEKTTIKVSSLEHLAKVAEEAFKPIMHHGDIFYVLDGDVRYEFSTVVVADVEEE